MKTVFALEPLEGINSSIFLAGPSPRGNIGNDWRPEVIEKLEKTGFKGTVLSPVNKNFKNEDYLNQINWEHQAMKLANRIIFWIPRSENMPGFTTNVEFGEYFSSGKIICGSPKEAIKNRYLQERFKPYGIWHSTIDELIKDALSFFNQPSKDFFTADTHFSQLRTMQLSQRPFINIDEMDYQLISNWNKTVSPNDVVYHLGDFGNPTIISFLSFKKMTLITGNYETEQTIADLLKDKRVELCTHPEYINPNNGERYVMMHEPNSHTIESNFYLFGHIHNLQMVKNNGFNVGTDLHNFTPVSLDTVTFRKNAIENHYDDNVFCPSCNNNIVTF